MKKFKAAVDIPPHCIVAPSACFAPRPGKKPAGSFEGNLYFARDAVSELLTKDEWRKLGRKVKSGEKPLAQRGDVQPLPVFADWQTE
jgi:hypothetical protein